MNYPFNAEQGLVIVRAKLVGPSGNAILRLALDTGATSSMINVAMLVAIGYDPSIEQARHQVTTGSGVEYVPRISLNEINALGRKRVYFPILAHTLPPSAGIDGLLGLDFLRSCRLTADFRDGFINLD